MDNWRVAKSLNQLLLEIDASAPNRSKAYDGAIGDAAHQSRTSDHNPWCRGWVVTARDYTHDPVNGFDSYVFAEWLRRRCAGEELIDGKREIRVKYVISNRKIASASSGFRWRAYGGPSPHDKHIHVSVDCTAEGGYMDSIQSWGWPHGTNPPMPAFPYPLGHYLGTPRASKFCHSGCYGGVDTGNVRLWQRRMSDRGWTISVDGCFRDQSERVAKLFQHEKGLLVDGRVGVLTWSATWAAPIT